MAASSTKTKVSLKLLIDTKNEKVLFAEASKAVIDFLFNLLCLPIGTVVKLLTTNSMVGSLGNLYQSVENMNDNYMQPNQSKDVLLNPKSHSSSTQIDGFITHNNVNDDNDGTDLFVCPHKCCFEVTNDKTTQCSNRYESHRMSQPVTYIKNEKVAEKRTTIKSGFVKDVVTFMVMDDLVIQPMSTISSITLLNKFNVKEIGTLQEKVVQMGMDEGIKLLKASLQSKMVLTSVFINKGN
ncbi:uncharacterized protein [Cicer arietinum]|uniref:Uncharacterized protein LOC101505540 n=1 Tax=Cicer arietinum TaxID=3827 RepID=A0A1S2Y0E9_CICAR|nr:uncharacterized protein LOC101505540 [Cicer arietinum]